MDLSQMPKQVLVGGVSKRLFVLHRWEGTLQPGEWRSWRPTTVCGSALWQESITLSKLLDPLRVRPCKRCFRDYEPCELSVTSSSGYVAVRIDPVEYPGKVSTGRVSVFGVRYHFMEPIPGCGDAFVPVCGTRGLVGGKGRLRFESEAIGAGALPCPDCGGGT